MIDFGIVKQTDAFKFLKRETDADKLSHAYMLIGKDGGMLVALSMLTVRYSMCKANCLTSDVNAICPTCQKIINGNHPDVKVINKSDRILVDEVKEIIAAVALKPFEGGDNYIIINDAANLTAQSQNKLLKTLEETPKGTHFFLCTTRPDMLLNTVRSRAVKITIAPLSACEIVKLLSAGEKDADLSDIELCAEYSGGSLSAAVDCLTNQDKLDALKLTADIPRIMQTSRDIVNVTDKLMRFKNHAAFIIDALEIRMSKMQRNPEYGFSDLAAARLIPEIIEAKKKLGLNCNVSAVTETLLFKILEVKKKCQQ